MKTVQVHLRKKVINQETLKPILDLKPQVVVAFANIDWANDTQLLKELKSQLPGTEIVGCSTAGEISNDGLFEKSMVLTAIRFESNTSKIQIMSEKVGSDQKQSGRNLGKKLAEKNLRGLFLFAPGVTVQGSSLLHGVKEAVGPDALLLGGLAGDGGKFVKTAVFHNDQTYSDHVIGLGFYGSQIDFHHSSKAGFRSFGGIRQITKANDHVVYEIDGQPALKVYKESLGKHADDLPSTGLMFPLALLNNQLSETGLIRAVLGVNEADQSMNLAGDVESGTFFKLMRAENQSLINGAQEAADKLEKNATSDSIGFLISCVARRMVMGDAVEDEIDAALGELKNCQNVSGFYAYGEFGPFFSAVDCQLHNQTMTVNILSERVT